MGTTAPHICLYIEREAKPLKGYMFRNDKFGTKLLREMNETRAPMEEDEARKIYQIRIQGHLDRWRADWFDGLTITLEDNGDTLLSGPVVDQAALHGLLRKVRDLGMTLLSVMRVNPKLASDPHASADNDQIIR